MQLKSDLLGNLNNNSKSLLHYYDKCEQIAVHFAAEIFLLMSVAIFAQQIYNQPNRQFAVSKADSLHKQNAMLI